MLALLARGERDAPAACTVPDVGPVTAAAVVALSTTSTALRAPARWQRASPAPGRRRPSRLRGRC